jgi:hypothetical protein
VVVLVVGWLNLALLFGINGDAGLGWMGLCLNGCVLRLFCLFFWFGLFWCVWGLFECVRLCLAVVLVTRRRI